MSLKDYTFDGSRKLELEKLPTNSKKDKVDKEEIIAKTKENLAKMQELQDRLYADGREGLIIVLQAMDAAGKDSTIKHGRRQSSGRRGAQFQNADGGRTVARLSVAPEQMHPEQRLYRNFQPFLL